MKATSVLLSVFVFCGFSSTWGSLLGSSKCSWGPGYWCSDLVKARECSATTHCIQNYWSQLELPPDDDEVCAICKEMVAEARDTLRSNETREELKEVFEGSCKLIPIKAIADECINIFDDFVPELVEALASEMNPQIVCATAGLCNSERIDRLLQNLYQGQGSSSKGMCGTCRSGVRKLSRHLRMANPQKLQLRLLDMCGEFSSYSDACKVTVAESFSDIHGVLKHNLNDEICDLMGVCSETFQTAVMDSNPSEDIECEFCEKVIQHWKDEWTSRTTIEEFKEVLDALCNKLHNTDRVNRCRHIVDDYYIPMFNFLAHEVQPKVICEMFGLCQNNLESFFQVSEDSSVFTLLLPEGKGDSIFQSKVIPAQADSTPTFEASENGSPIFQRKVFPAQETVDSAPTYEANRLEDEDYPWFTVKEAQRVVPQTPLFSLFPASRGDDFQVGIFEASSLNEDGTPLIELEAAMVLQVPTTAAQEGGNSLSEDSDLGCQLCKEVIMALKSQVNNKTEEEIKDKLEKMCLAFPPVVRNQCKEFVDKYTDQIINGIIRDLTAEEICHKIHLCSKPKLQNYAPVSSIQCKICEEVLKLVEHSLKNKKSEAAIRHALSEVCHKVPFFLKKECKKFVGKYTDAIVKAILKGLKPHEVCHKIHICMVEKTITSPAAVSSIKCKICKEVLRFVEHELKNKKSEAAIRHALSQVCHNVPHLLRKECNKFVGKYTDAIVKAILKGLNPDQVCHHIHICMVEKTITTPAAVSSVKCKICKEVLKLVEHELKNKKSEAAIRHALSEVCHKVPHLLRKECNKFVGKYTDAIVKAILKGLNPDQVCHQIHICMMEKSPAKKPIKCFICTKAVKILNSEIKNKTNNEEIKKAISTLCTKFPKGFVRQCKKFVGKYTKQLIVGIKKGIAPKKLCEDLQLCKPKVLIVREEAPVDNTAGCVLCEYIIGELDVYLNNKGNRDSIEHALDAVCDMMSSPASKKKCQEFVDTYINMILETFTHGMTPKELCQLIYICQNGEAQTRELGFAPENQCKICDGIFTEIYEDVLDKEEEIKEALRNVCYAVLSGSDVDSCKTMVDTYVSMIISSIMTHDSPEAFCRNFYQCEDESSLPEESEDSSSSLHPNDIPPLEIVLSQEYSMGRFCEDCMKVVNEMENSALTNNTMDFTVRALQMVCSTFPSPVDTRCEGAIDEIDSDIEGFFANNPPKSVCKYLRLCPSNLYDPASKLWDASVVGGGQCIWGPEYWCKSLIHARTCGTVDHCKNTVWL